MEIPITFTYEGKTYERELRDVHRGGRTWWLYERRSDGLYYKGALNKMADGWHFYTQKAEYPELAKQLVETLKEKDFDMD